MQATIPALLTITLVTACADDKGPGPTTGGGSTAGSGAGTSAGSGTGTTGTAGGASAGSTAGSGGQATVGSATGVGSGSGGGASTWNNFAADFFETYCWACHGPGDPEGRDFSTLAGVMAEADTIACGVSPTKLDGCAAFPPPGQFPVGDGPKPTEQERLDLVAWIEAGLPEG